VGFEFLANSYELLSELRSQADSPLVLLLQSQPLLLGCLKVQLCCGKSLS
jgi:hypothetical protein